MRRGLFFFLIVLTLLRGLVAPAMAAGMALPHFAATAASQESPSTAAPPLHTGHANDGHTAQHAMAAAQQSWPAHDGQADHGSHCQDDRAMPASGTDGHASACGEAGLAHAACADCDICHTAVMAPLALRSTFDARVGAKPDLRPSRFASALPALATKPPIS